MSSGERPNLSVVFRAPGLAEKVPLDPAVHYWVVSPAVAGLMGRLDMDDRWWAITQKVDTRIGTGRAGVNFCVVT